MPRFLDRLLKNHKTVIEILYKNGTVGVANQNPHKESYAHPNRTLPGRPIAHYLGLLCLNNEFLYGIVANCFGLIGSPGTPARPYANPTSTPIPSTQSG